MAKLKSKQNNSSNTTANKKNKQSAASKKDVDSVNLTNQNLDNSRPGSTGEDF